MPRSVAEETIEAVEAGRGNAREILDGILARRSFDPRNRDLAREIAYGALRRLSTLDHLLEAHSRHRLRTLHPRVRAALRVAAYQLLFLDRVPAAAAVDRAVDAARAGAGERAAGYANAVLRALSREVEGRFDGDGDADPRRCVPTGDGRHARLSKPRLPDPERDAAASLALRWSVPRWLAVRWTANLGPDRALEALRASAARPGTWLRPLPGRADALRAALSAAGVAFEAEGDPPSFLLRGAGAVEELPGFREGLFVVQDPAAGRAVDLLAPRAGDTVLEIGAGRGGKTAFLAARVAPGGMVTAVDRDGRRLALLRETLARVLPGEEGAEVIEGDALADGVLPQGPFDRVLVDAPCSNTGVLARRVEVRGRLEKSDLESLGARCRRLLEAGLARLRPGGVAVHSVCSLEPEEGPDAVRRAIRGDASLSIEAEETLIPVPGRRDGGYAALVRRSGD